MELKVKVEIVEKVSKSGNVYYVLKLTFDNGYQIENFLDKRDMIIITNHLKTQ